MHVPVLKTEVLKALNLKPNQNVIDCTIGAGGHAESILQQTNPNGQLLGLDVDPAAIKLATTTLKAFAPRVHLINANFDQLRSTVTEAPFYQNQQNQQKQPVWPIHAILADLGVSSMQLNQPERGFSFAQDGPLDMRMGPAAKQSAATLINNLTEKALADLIYRYGEERKSRRIARAIVKARPIDTTSELAEVISRAVGGRRGRKIHPATRTFQAIRIAVNDELGALERFLPQAISLLAPGGRLTIISFHSLEDRIVKHFFRREATGEPYSPPPPYPSYSSQPPIQPGKHQATINIVTKKPITATQAEILANPRARSAKLRVAEIKERL